MDIIQNIVIEQAVLQFRIEEVQISKLRSRTGYVACVFSHYRYVKGRLVLYIKLSNVHLLSNPSQFRHTTIVLPFDRA